MLGLEGELTERKRGRKRGNKRSVAAKKEGSVLSVEEVQKEKEGKERGGRKGKEVRKI